MANGSITNDSYWSNLNPNAAKQIVYASLIANGKWDSSYEDILINGTDDDAVQLLVKNGIITEQQANDVFRSETSVSGTSDNQAGGSQGQPDDVNESPEQPIVQEKPDSQSIDDSHEQPVVQDIPLSEEEKNGTSEVNTTWSELLNIDAEKIQQTKDDIIANGKKYADVMRALISDSTLREDAKIFSIYSGIGNYDINFSEIANTQFDTETIDSLIDAVGKLSGNLTTIKENVDQIDSQFNGLNEDTRTKLSASYGSNGEFLKKAMQDSVEKWSDYIGQLSTNLTTASGIAHANDGLPPEEDPTIPETPEGESGDGYNGPGSGNGSGNFSGIQGGNGGNGGKKPQKDVYALVGTLTFTGIVPLYSKLGKNSTIQSSLNGSYDVLGIISQDNKYYYKIYDKKLKKTYYVEIDENSKLETEYKDVLKSKETSMMLKEPNVGEKVLAKMTDPNEVYFVNGSTPGQGEAEGITFANVIDSTDSNNYYVPLSDSVEVVSVDSFISGITGSADNVTITSAKENVG